MKPKFLMLVLALFLALPFAASMNGCSSDSSNNQGGGIVTYPTVDMAVSDKGWDTGIFQILLWFDVLNYSGTGFPLPDVTLDVSSTDIEPSEVKIFGNDLVVRLADTTDADSGIYIWRDYLNLSDGDDADVILSDGNTAIVYPWSMILDSTNDRLFVGEWNDGDALIHIWDNFSSLTSGDAPDVTITDGADELIDNPTDLVLDQEGSLFVANWTSTQVDNPCISIFHNASSIDADQAPDVQLDCDDSFFLDDDATDNVQEDSIRDLYLELNPLTGTEMLFAASGYGEWIFVFNDANSLSDNDLPDTLLFSPNGEPGSLFNTINDMAVFNNSLFVSANNWTDQEWPNNPGILAFGPFNALQTGQTPWLMLTPEESQMNGCEHFAFAGGALLSTCKNDANQYNVSSVHIFKDAANLQSGQAADILIPGDENIDNTDNAPLNSARGIAAVVRDFNNF